MGLFFEKRTRKRSKPLEIVNILLIIAFAGVLYYGFTTNFGELFFRLVVSCVALFAFLEAAASIFNKEDKWVYLPSAGLGVVCIILAFQ
ncbi:hypothetical protein [Paenisporosarcina sp. NPDC076898]|uniref:hypothetical protein n=1 Tax=unclassified Paenisporosarcina TaxID=2642018 RepID=UPI003D0341DB